MNWQDLEPLLARNVEAFIDGRWQTAHFIGFGPGYTDDDIEIVIMTETQFTNHNRQKKHTFICKQNELATRIRRIATMKAVKVDGTGVTQPVSGTITTNIGNDKKHKFHVGDRVLVTVAVEQIVNEPATVEDVGEEVGLYWCVFDKQFNPQWFAEERLQERQAE